MKPKNPPANKKGLNWATILTILGIIVSVVAVWYARQGVKVSQETADRALAFDRADNYLGLADLDLPPPNNGDTVNLIYGGVFDKKGINIAMLPFSITNFGHKNAESVKLIIDYPTGTNMAFTDTDLLKSNKIPFTEFRRNLIDGKEDQLITYQLNELNPALRVNIGEPFFLHLTEMTDSTRTKDGKMIPYTVTYSYIFSTMLLGKDLSTQKQFFSITCLEAKGKDELIDKFMSHFQRKETKRGLYYFIYPNKSSLDRRGDKMINQYQNEANSLCAGMVDNTHGDKDLPLAIYNAEAKLVGVRVYDKENKLKAIVPVK